LVRHVARAIHGGYHAFGSLPKLTWVYVLLPAVRAAKATGKGIRKIAGELGIGVGTVQRIVG
jgi:hypothetical protein